MSCEIFKTKQNKTHSVFLELKGKKNNNYAKQLLVFRGRRQVSGNQTNNKFWKFPKEWGFLTPEQGWAAAPGGGALLLFPKDHGRAWAWEGGRNGQESPQEEACEQQGRALPCPFPTWELGIETGVWVRLGDSPDLAIPQRSKAAHWSILIYWLEMLALKDLTQLCTWRCPKAECHGDWRLALTLFSGLLWGFALLN